MTQSRLSQLTVAGSCHVVLVVSNLIISMSEHVTIVIVLKAASPSRDSAHRRVSRVDSKEVRDNPNLFGLTRESHKTFPCWTTFAKKLIEGTME